MLSIIIITLNEEKNIGILLKQLHQQSWQNFEVIIVDSNSDDNTCSIARNFSDQLDLKVHKMGDRGVSLGRNTGASIARYERLLFLDADVNLAPDFLARSMIMLSARQLDVAGVYMGAGNLPLTHKFGYSLFNLGLFFTQYFFPTAVGACIFSTRTIHKRLGGFDEKIILCEDCDYVLRASKTWRFRLLPITFGFNPRRLNQDGTFRMGLLYLRANIRRFFEGEMRNNEIEYRFGHYS